MTIESLAHTGSPHGAPESAHNPALSKDAFLKLLVAQLRNQNPMQPADGVEFLSQLAQFSHLEQTVGIRQELEIIRAALTTPAGDSSAR